MKKVVKKKKKVTHRPSTLHREARGISKIVILAVVALVLAGVGSMYVLGQNGVKTPMTSLVKPALNPNCELKDPELCKFMNNFQAQKNYSVTTTAKGGGMNMESLMEMSGENNFHVVSKQDGKEVSNMISIGDTSYMLDYKDNKWWKTTVKPDDTILKQAKEMKDEFKTDEKQTEDKTVYKFITKEACESMTCFKYEVVSPDSNGMKQYMWFDDSEYLLRKLVMDDATGGTSESVYSYGKVSISAPSPVKEGNPYGDAAASDPQLQKMMQQYQQQAQPQGGPDSVPDQNTSDTSSPDTPSDDSGQ